MINTYYQQQLALLRELGAEFGRKYPALAPMLAGQSADPDVERLIEGSAFLSGLVHERLDDDFPELVHNLTELMFPHYLHPVPSSSVIRFTPAPELSSPETVTAGSALGSVPVDGEVCTFTTVGDVTILPLKVEGSADRGTAIEIRFRFTTGSLQGFGVKDLRLFASGDFRDTSDLIFDLAESLRRVEYQDEDGTIELTPAEALEIFSSHELSVIPYSKKIFSAFRSVQEFFQLPEIFTFFRLKNLDRLKGSADSFTVRLIFSEDRLDRIREHSDVSFELFCVPVVNVFRHEADAMQADYRTSEYMVRPRGGGSLRVYSVDSVTGYVQGSVKEKVYRPFQRFNPQTEKVPVYSVRRRKSRIDKSTDVFVSIAVPTEKEEFVPETLVLGITCTNGRLADRLRLGDISGSSENIPLFVTYSNITQPTCAAECPLGRNLLWRLLSHVYLNQTTIATTESLTSLLKLYIYVDTDNKAAVQANTRKVESIVKVEQQDAVRLMGGIPVRGKRITIHFSREGFSSRGDMYIFAWVIQKMMVAYTAVNNFTEVSFVDLSDGRMFLCRTLQTGSRSIL